ncbi:hypothetical protein Pla108_38360 [Botrimarina colliarenosi]|uniref:LamG-like jellyroll fold domain-containing protein n=1 Tax=Botrimarina colliarenosi TaxID=2528001 RepID=A0A5C6A2K1_9BACT|nr:LamG domain-containing protein [Botrimarina colliarenosi]TWT94124.1 hypothetical protein Pla108_38360 [Botrimarina colliarenosi]
MTQQQKQADVTSIVLAAVAGDAPIEDLQRLERMLSEDPSLTPFVVNLMNQESWLAWQSAKASDGATRADILAEIAKAVGTDSRGAPFVTPPQVTEHRASSRRGEPTPHVISRLRIDWSVALAVALLVATGALLGATVARSGWMDNDDLVAVSEKGAVDASDQFVVRYVRGTACLWNPGIERGYPEPKREVEAGESLNLLQGIAELDFELPNGSAILKVEGPAGLVITQGHSATLSSGVFTVDTDPTIDEFRLQTPSGVLEFAGDCSAGVRIAGGEAELHVFEGRAQVTVPWSSGAGDSQLLDVVAGSSVALSTASDGRIRIDRGAASEASFAAKRSMESDSLKLPANYPDIVAQSNPLLYWRFEERRSDVVRDYSGNGLHGKVIGEVDWVQSDANNSLSLGGAFTGDAIGSYVKSAQPISDRLADGYTVELWFKSSHYHWGNVFSLLDCRPGSASYGGHGVALELGGARSNFTDLERPARIRFLHRDPPSADVAVGTSIFSESHYELRRWQHLAAVKTDSGLRLFVDGEQVASADELSPLASGLSLLLGQLDEHQFYRRFVGQIDELAVYARQLDASEIVRHFELVRPKIKTNGAKPSADSDLESSIESAI